MTNSKPRLRVWTARIGYVGADALDVSRKGADDYRRRTGNAWEGEAWAPSWTILGPSLQARKAESTGDVAMDRAASAAWWPFFADAYRHELRQSYRTRREEWDALLARSEITLTCSCTDPERCHRTILAEVLEKCGARRMGERRPSR